MNELERQLIEILNLHFTFQQLDDQDHTDWCRYGFTTFKRGDCECGRTLLENLDGILASRKENQS